MTPGARALVLFGAVAAVAVIAGVAVSRRRRRPGLRRRRNPSAPMDRAVRDFKVRQSRTREKEARTVGRALKLEQARRRCSSERAGVKRACKERRAEALERTREECAEDRRAVADLCAEDRDRVRDEVAAAVAAERAKREAAVDEFEDSRVRGSRFGREKRSYSTERRDESDSLALGNIPQKYHRLWGLMKRRYPLSLAPDMRAEQFMEEVSSWRDDDLTTRVHPTEGATAFEEWLTRQDEKEEKRMIREKSREEWAEQRRLDAEKKAKARAARQARIAKRAGRSRASGDDVPF